MAYDAEIRTRLRKILTDAFDLAGLEALVRAKVAALDARLDQIVDIGKPLNDVAFRLVEVVEQRSLVEDLVRGIVELRGNRSDVRALASDLGLSPIDEAGHAPARPTLLAVKEYVIRFNERFAQRREQFGFLSGLKKFHETLHKLQESRVAITQAADRFAKNPANTLEIEMLGEDLRSDCEAAEKNRILLEERSDAEWVDAFGDAVSRFMAAAVSKDLVALAKAVEDLTALPNQQAGLNSELVRCARRLKPQEFVPLLDKILEGLTSGEPNAPRFLAEFRTRLDRFRTLCGQLPLLIEVHDGCQHVETSLGQAETLLRRDERAVITPDRVLGWDDVRSRFRSIADRRPTDPDAARVAQLADSFQMAAEADPADSATIEFWFTTMLGRFRKFFLEVDDELLNATDQMVQEAAYLDVQLRTATDVH